MGDECVCVLVVKTGKTFYLDELTFPLYVIKGYVSLLVISGRDTETSFEISGPLDIKEDRRYMAVEDGTSCGKCVTQESTSASHLG